MSCLEMCGFFDIPCQFDAFWNCWTQLLITSAVLFLIIYLAYGFLVGKFKIPCRRKTDITSTMEKRFHEMQAQQQLQMQMGQMQAQQAMMTSDWGWNNSGYG